MNTCVSAHCSNSLILFYAQPDQHHLHQHSGSQYILLGDIFSDERYDRLITFNLNIDIILLPFIVYLPNKVVKLALHTLNFLHISLKSEQLKDNYNGPSQQTLPCADVKIVLGVFSLSLRRRQLCKSL